MAKRGRIAAPARRRGAVAGQVLRRLIGVVLTSAVAVAVAGAGDDRVDGFENLFTDQGLASTIYGVVQDQNGFLWLATEGGLVRYDGYDFKTFRHHPDDPGSLSSDNISSLIKDRDGFLWLATWGGGLERFDPASEDFVHHRAHPERADRLQDDRVQRVYEDPDGGLWAGTFSGGLSRYDRATGGFNTYRHDPRDPASLGDDRVWWIAEDATGLLWVATGAGISIFDRATETFDRLRHDPADPTSLSDDAVRTLYLDREGTMWAGTATGLDRFDRERQAFDRFAIDDDPTPSGTLINRLFEDSRGGFWVGTTAGLRLWDRDAGRGRRFLHAPADPRSLSHNDVRDLYQDRSGVLWLATRGGGLSKLDRKPAKFLHLGRPGDPDGLPDPRVRSLAEDIDGGLWIGTPSGLHRWHGERLTPAPLELPANDIHHLLVDADGDLWIATGQSGLSHFDRRDGAVRTYRHDPADPGSLDHDFVTALYQDRAGELWVGNFSGLDRLDRETGTFEHHRPRPQDPQTLSDGLVTALYEDRDGALWVGTWNSGLNRLAPDRHRFDHFVADAENPASLSNNRVHALHETAAGTLWVATAHGLNRFLPDGTFQRYLEHDGLPSAYVASILADERGSLWLGTGDGLCRFDPETGAVRNYTPSDGLQDKRFAIGSAVRTRHGQLVFGGDRGFNVFDPEQVVDNRFVPPIVLTGFAKFGQAVQFARATDAIDKIQLAHDDNFFSFEFAALDFTHPQDNRYRYRLEGFDRGWIDAGTRRSASYTNVDPGDYVFRVQGSNNDGIWNENGVAVAVEIVPPFWHTSWFRALALLGLVAASGGVYRFRVRHLHRREHELARRVEAGLADLRRSEERNRLLFERNLAGVVRATPGGRIIDCNDAFAKIFGYDSRAECRQHLRMDFETATAGRPALLTRLRQEDLVQGHESTARARDGAEITLLWNAHLHPGEADDEGVIEATVIDVSEARRIEESMRRAQKLESLGVLAGGIAHDFNNLLTSILGSAELARIDLAPDARARRHLEVVEKAAEHAANLSKLMLAYSGKGEFLVTRLELTAAVREVAELVQGAISKKATLAYRLAAELPAIEADASQIGQVVMNLITNASDALGPQGGTITVTTGCKVFDAEFLAETYLDHQTHPGNYVFLEVEDDGCGMDRETQTRIFDPFFTTKFAGRGLGLAAVLGIVRGHHGAIRIESEPGRGSRFTVLFPVAETRVEETTVIAPDDPEWHGEGTVLLVDDEEAIRYVAQEMVTRLGFDAVTAADGQEAVDIYRRRGQEIDLVILDLAMPRMNGEEAFLEIRRLDPDARILLASGYDEGESVKRFLGRGLSGFVQKPYRLATLSAKIRQALATEQPGATSSV